MVGRKPTPSNIIKIYGNHSHSRDINKEEPTPEVSIPKSPKFLNKYAKQEWNRIVPELEKLGLISQIDRAALSGYCQAWGRWFEAEEMVKEKGQLYKTPNGAVQTSPYLWIANKALDQMHKFASEFGMTPSSRTRCKIEKPKEKGGEIEDFMKEAKKENG